MTSIRNDFHDFHWKIRPTEILFEKLFIQKWQIFTEMGKAKSLKIL